MERKKKSALCNKVISLFTSLLMVLSTIIGYIPTSAVSVSAADSYPLQEISSGTKLSTLRTYNPERDILINPTPEKYPVTRQMMILIKIRTVLYGKTNPEDICESGQSPGLQNLMANSGMLRKVNSIQLLLITRPDMTRKTNSITT
mgnify:CR=1 FL=1